MSDWIAKTNTDTNVCKAQAMLVIPQGFPYGHYEPEKFRPKTNCKKGRIKFNRKR